MSDALMKFLGNIMMANSGSTMAHEYIRSNSAREVPADRLRHRLHRGEKLFIPPKAEDRVIMFADKSGVYVHADGFATPMGSDISHEVGAWTPVPT